MKQPKVIWYLSKRNRWCITPSEQIGSWSCSIHSKNYGNLDPWNIPREKWSYNGVETESDFAVECSGNGRTGGQSNGSAVFPTLYKNAPSKRAPYKNAHL